MRRLLAALAFAVFIIDPVYAFGLAERAQSHLGKRAAELGLPRSLWCADFMNMLLGRSGASRRARDYRHYGTAAPHGCTDCIAVIAPCGRGRWHVGVVAGYDGNGNPLIVSGNHNRRVDQGIYPRACVKAYRAP